MEALKEKPPLLTEHEPGLIGSTPPGLYIIEGGGEANPSRGSLELVAPEHDYLLGDVDDLARYAREDGTYAPEAAASVLQNKITAVQEGAIPYAVSDVKHQWFTSPEGDGGVIMDLGRTAVETAMRGAMFYKSPEAQARCEIEVEQARHKQETLRPGIAQIFIEPKMTLKDAPLEVAKAEGLADTDSIQMSWLKVDEKGQPEEVDTQCLLAADVPIEAWVDMLADEDNIFGKSIVVDDPESALSVMETYAELEIPVEKLPEGPVSILAAVIPYIKDPDALQKVADHVEEFRQSDQEELHQRAVNPAERWVEFDKTTEQSLRAGYASDDLQRFIESLDGSWTDKDRIIIDKHKILHDGKTRYEMTRELASILQKAEENLILTAAAVVVKNERVLKQISPEVADKIYQQELVIQEAQKANIDVRFVQMQQHNANGLIARQKVKVGGGCSGENNAFGEDTLDVSFSTDTENTWGVSLNSSNTRGRRDRRGSLKFKCQNGHSNERPYGELIEKCKTCKVSVKC